MMPIYPVICPDGHETETYCRHSELADQVCETCGKPVQIQYTRLHITAERRFYGEKASTSTAHFFHPDEVALARKALGPALARDSQIADTGHVTFRSRSEERQFVKRMHYLREKYDPGYKVAQEVNAASKAKRDGTYRKKIRQRRGGRSTD